MVELLVVFGNLSLLGVIPGREGLVELGVSAPLLGFDEPDGGQNWQLAETGEIEEA